MSTAVRSGSRADDSLLSSGMRASNCSQMGWMGLVVVRAR